MTQDGNPATDLPNSVALQSLVDRIELIDVHLLRVSSQRRDFTPVTMVDAGITISSSYRIGIDSESNQVNRLNCRFNTVVVISTEQSHETPLRTVDDMAGLAAGLDIFEMGMSTDQDVTEPDAFAHIEVDLVVEFVVSGDGEPETAVVTRFVDEYAFVAAVPFIREAIHGATSRIGLPPFTLGLYRRDTGNFAGFAARDMEPSAL